MSQTTDECVSGRSVETVLCIRDLHKSFASKGGPPVEALRGVSLDVRCGEVVGLVGPDGAGKTTLLRIATGLLVPDRGTATVLALDAVRDTLQIRGRITYMPQKFGLYEDLTVQENLDLYADLQGVEPAARAPRYARLLEMTGLERFTDRLAGKLSGGMKQKLGLACALIKSPELMLLDEPTVGVDPVSRRELWRIVYQMVEQEGIGVLVATAYLDEAEKCHRVVVLHEGQKLEEGTPASFRQRVRGHTFVVQPRPGVRPRAIQGRLAGQPGIVDATIRGGRVRVVTEESDNAAVARALPDGLAAGMEAAGPTFEDAFLKLLADARSSQGHADVTGARAKSLSQTALGAGPAFGAGLPTPPKPATAGLPPWTGDLRSDSWLGQRPATTRSDSWLGQRPATTHAAGADSVVHTRGLTKRFGSFTAVSEISFDVHRGEIFGLLGPNGAGKSTTFRMLCGLSKVSGGEVRVAGRDLRRARSFARQRLGYMAQQFSLYGQLSVIENLRFFGRAYGLSKARLAERIEWGLEEFDLRGQRDAMSGKLPVGYKQRLAMAAAMLHEPDILFLDEPTSGVDPLARRDFWRRINSFAEGGVTVVVTTHFMEEAEYCDRMLIMSQGRELATGTPDEIRALARTATHPDPTIEDAFIALAEGTAQPPAREGSP
ncbi:MAG TPA: ATP-binding cassette domain-containing protein [Candidatus Anammoximicrobium sp.]|nr:ATP-binding cassette domain-containing protein [Candidatus Anammoximicrobium sp.]